MTVFFDFIKKEENPPLFFCANSPFASPYPYVLYYYAVINS
jgi:hypothetical protein